MNLVQQTISLANEIGSNAGEIRQKMNGLSEDLEFLRRLIFPATTTGA